MPLQGKKPFVRQKPPQDLHPDEELFYCKITHEVFREYEKFFDRVILCNSLVWTCSVTGKNGLTYQEAVDCESNARRTLKKFPEPLKKPLLYLASLTTRTRLNDMCDDVFNFVKDRYFLGEEVEVSLNGIKKNCEIKKVISPEKEKEKEKSPKEKEKSPTKPEKPKRVKAVGPDKLKYEVKEKEHGKTVVVKSQCLSRPKGTFTKPHNKLFLKHYTSSESGIWKVKLEAIEKHDLSDFKFGDVFSGSLPKYAIPTPKKKSLSAHKGEKSMDKKSATDSSGKKTIQGKLNFKKDGTVEKKKHTEKEQAEFEQHRLLLQKEKEKRKEEMKKRMEEDKERMREKKLKEREQKKEEKRIQAEYLLSWKKPRDDLECDDLKDLPKSTPLECEIPQDCFSDAVMVLEFLNAFREQINLKDSFPHGFTFDQLEKALTETNIEGYLNDLIQHLLTSVFQLQDWEDEKINMSDKAIKKFNSFGGDSPLTTEQAASIASYASSWPQLFHGTILRNMPLDSFSVTEILRLHILASGSDRNRAASFGVTGFSEDPGLTFKVEEPELVKKLGETSVFHLTCEERLKILSLLIHQLLCCSTIRNVIEENVNKVRPLRQELRHLRWARTRHLREIALSKVKKKPDDKDVKSANGEVNGNENPEPAPDGMIVVTAEDEKENIETPELTPEEIQALEEQKAKEEIRRKAEFKRKETELLNQIQQIESSYQIEPLGRDRAFRRFWVFRSLPGIFIEDDDKSIGPCLLKETPQIPPNAGVNRSETSVTSIRKYLQHLDDPKNGSSDKENDILQDLAIIQSDIIIPLKDRKLSDLNTRVDLKKSTDGDTNTIDCVQCREKMVDLQGGFPKFCPHIKQPSIFGLCTACIDTCPVHNINAPRTKWSFYYMEEDLELLLNTLNSRGFREGALKETLVQDKEMLKEMLSKCQYYSLNKALPPPEVRKSQRHQPSRKSDFHNMKPEEALELTLRDMILELEQRMYEGALGFIKVNDHEAWRIAIEQGTYDRQCVELKWGFGKSLNDLDLELLSDEDRKIKHLACALLQLSQGIEARYLHPPLGESDKSKDKAKNVTLDVRQKKDAETEKDNNSSPKHSKTALFRWQESLMKCCSLSQLFVYLGTLERSVAWSRSVLKAHCRICRRRGDAENMLLCDLCNRGHHLYCLKPPLTEIPQGDWFCLSCKPPEKMSPQKKERVIYTEEDSDVDDESEEESDEDDEYEDQEDDSDASSEEVSYEVCESCGDSGTVICCDRCPKVYHPECVGLRRIPRGEWLCPKCVKKEESLKKTQKHSPGGNYGTRAQTVVDRHSSKSRKSPAAVSFSKGSKRQRKESSDSDFTPPSKKVRIGSRRQRKESSDSDVTPPKKVRADRERTSNESAEKENPFKKIYRDSDVNALRRRSKSAGGGDMLDYKTCLDMIVELMHHPSSWPFLAPVSKKDAPEYHLVIKRPMDFGTIKSKLNNMSYTNNGEFVRDLYLVLQNCELFNARKSPEYKAARVVHKEVKRLLKAYNLSSTNIPLNAEDLLI